MRIGIDIDNVIADSYPAYIEKFNRTFNASIRFEEAKDFSYLVRYQTEKNTSGTRFVDQMLMDEEFQLSFVPISNSSSVIQKWIANGYGLHYITARPIFSKKSTINWLKKHGFWSKKTTLDLFDLNKYTEDTLYKKERSLERKIDLMVEDALEIALALTHIPVILFDRPWNQGKLPQNVTRVYNWQEIDAQISAYAKLYKNHQ